MKNKFKNQLFHLVNELGYSPNDFELKENINFPADSDFDSTIIVHKNSNYMFIIRENNQAFDEFDCQFTYYAPNQPLSDFYPHSDFTSFDYILDIFKEWTSTHLKKYIESSDDEPDLWENFKKRNESINFNKLEFEETSFFTEDENKQITLAINELKYLIKKNIVNTDEEQILVNNRLDYLIENTNRLNKFEWKSLLISTLISITISLTLDTEKGKLLFELLKKAFNIFPKFIQ